MAGDNKSFKNDSGAEKTMMLELKNTLKSSPPPRSFLRYYFKATVGQSHSHSTACMQLNQEIHPDLAREIQRIVQNGTTSVRDVKMLLEQYVEKLFADDSKPKPARINKAFYPTDKVIYAHIYSAKKSQIAQAYTLAVQNYEYIIIDGEVTEVPQVIEVAEVCTVSEEIHDVPITDQVAKAADVDREFPDSPAANEVVEVSQVNNEIQHAPSTGEVVETSQVDEVQNVSATGEAAAIYQENEVQSAPATDGIAVVCQVQNTPAAEVIEIPHVGEELPNNAEPSSSAPQNLEKAQENIRDKAKRIIDLSYVCNDVEALTSVNLALAEQCTEMESKVDLR